MHSDNCPLPNTLLFLLPIYSLASRFLIDKLQKEQPENFNMVVNTLLAKAVDLNDEKLVSNPYLQIKAIFEMNSTLRRKEQGGLFPL
jgi:hypothetical protein